MPSLLQLTQDEHHVLQALYDADGEISSDHYDLLVNLGRQIAEKADRCATFIQATEQEIEHLKEDEAALAAKRKRLEKGLEGFRLYVLSVLGPDGMRRGERGMLRWRWATKRPLKILDEDPMHYPEYFRKLVPAHWEIDKELLRSRLEANVDGKRDPVALCREGTEEELARLDPPTPWLEVK